VNIKEPVPARAAAYCALYPMLHNIAKENGYALAVHGTLHRDMDLVAIPWIEEACEPEHLIKLFKEATATVIHHEDSDDLIEHYGLTQKPHGRQSFSLHLTNSGMYRGYLDISIMPKTKGSK
jgi:hypothetical protein